MTATKIPLKIVMFENSGGSLSFQVTGTIHGERIQKNFPTDAEARTFINGLLAAAGQGESSPQRIAHPILPTNVQLYEAELAWPGIQRQVLIGFLVATIDYPMANGRPRTPATMIPCQDSFDGVPSIVSKL